MRNSGSAMRNRRFILAATALNSFTLGMLYPVLAIHTFGMGRSLFYVGVVSALPYLGQILMGLAWGHLSDRLGARKGVIAATTAVGSLLFLLYPLAGTIELLLLVRFLQVAFLASIALIYTLATEEDSTYSRGVAKVGMASGFGGVLGGALGTLIYSPAFLWPFFIVCALTGLLSALMVLPVRERPAAGQFPGGGPAGGLGFIFRGHIARLLLFTVLLMWGASLVYSLFPVYLGTLSVPTPLIGPITGSAALTGAFAMAPAGRLCEKHGRRAVLLGAAAAYLATWSLFAVVTDAVFLALLWALPVGTFFFVSTAAALSDLTARHRRGRIMGALFGAMALGNLAGSIASGALAEFLGYRMTFALSVPLVLAAMAVVAGFRGRGSGNGGDGEE